MSVVGGFTRIIGLISIQVGLKLDLSTGTELCKNANWLKLVLGEERQSFVYLAT